MLNEGDAVTGLNCTSKSKHILKEFVRFLLHINYKQG